MLRDGRAVLLGALASTAVHLVVAGALFQLPVPPRVAVAAISVPFEAAGPVRPPGETRDADDRGRRARTPPAPLVPGGVRSAQNVDARSRGEGGDASGASQVILLLPVDQGVTLQDTPMTAYHVGQTSRLDTSDDRATWEVRRATPHPDDQVFVATGPGAHPERRPVSDVDARRGARRAPAPSTEGAARTSAARAGLDLGHRGEGPAAPGRAATSPGADHAAAAGAERDSPGRGIRAGRGPRADEAARVAHARPPVDEGPAATQARDEGRVRDDADAEALAAMMTQSWVESTARRGAEPGAGRGGVGGGGAPGSGGDAGEGGVASPYGPGGGPWASLDTGDRRYVRWYLEQSRRVRRNLRFPVARAVAMDQGVSVFRLVVRRDGAFSRPPRLVRSSGFADLDAEARRAIDRSAPFGAIPPELAPGRPALSIELVVEHANPMVR